MENNEDIKIVEELKKVEERISKNQVFAKEDRNTAIKRIKAIENLLSRLKTAERMNDVLAEKIESHCNYEHICFITSHHTYCAEQRINKKDCKQCIKEWARKKVEDEKDNTNN